MLSALDGRNWADKGHLTETLKLPVYKCNNIDFFKDVVYILPCLMLCLADR